MKVYLGSDHAGYELKEKVKEFLMINGFDYEDFGTDSVKRVDYPDYAKVVAEAVVGDEGSRGILICGTGLGMAIAANRVKGVRAVAACDAYSAKVSRLDNDSNVLTFGGRGFSFEDVEKIMRVWLGTAFSGKARHERRIRKLDE